MLIEYMGFRHFYRHAYSFMLNWSEMKRLVLNIEIVWLLIKEDVDKFIKELEK